MLRQLTANVWTATSSFRMLPGAHLPTRMTVVRRGDGSVLLHSPIELSDELVQAISELGPVRTVVVPNAFHHLHAQAALQRFPEARCLAAAGVEKKQPNLPIAASLEEEADRLEPDFDVTQLEGAPKLNEWVLRHRDSGALITTDLLFNVTEPQGWLTPLVLKMAGTNGGLAISRITKSLVKDSAAFTRSIERSIGSGVQHLVMSHGDVVSTDAELSLRRAIAERFA